MSRIRRNGGLIGRANDPKPFGKSGVWSMEEATAAKASNGNAVLDSTNTGRPIKWESNNTDFDPYYNMVTLHLGDADYPTNLMADQSQYKQEHYQSPEQYYTHHLPSYFGPRYQDWCTKFHEDAYYTVTDYSNIRLSSLSFTIEFWIKPMRNDATEYYVMGKGTGAGRASSTLGWVIYITSTNTIGFYDGALNVSLESSAVLKLDQWSHIAIVRNSTGLNDTFIWVNGSSRNSATISSTYADTNNLYIGRDRVATGTTWFAGMLTELRITNNPLYSGLTFTPPTTAFDPTFLNVLFSLSVTCPYHNNFAAGHPQGATVSITGSMARLIDSPFLDNTTKLTGHGATSLYVLDGSRQCKMYDTDPVYTPMRLGLNPFTVEAYVYFHMDIANRGIIGKGNGNNGSGNGWTLLLDSNGNLEWFDNSTTLVASGNYITYGGWYHVAAVREGTGTNQFRMYVNGKVVYTGTVSSNYNQTDYTYLFASRNAQYTYRGSIAGLRVTNGVALYNTLTNYNVFSTSFIDSVMTTSTSTALLIGTVGTGPALTNAPAWANYGTVRTSVWRQSNEVRTGTQHPFGRTGHSVSNITNGSASVVAYTTQNDFNFDYGDFSIEFWHLDNYAWEGFNTTNILVDTRNVFNDAGICIARRARRSIDVMTAGRPILDCTITDVLSPRVWTHICVQRVSGFMALYVNGKRMSECYYPATIMAGNQRIWIGNGAYPNINYTSHCYGKISNFRVVKGSAAYQQGTTIVTTATTVSAGGNSAVTLSSVDNLAPGMPIQFTGTSGFGGISTSTVYFIKSIIPASKQVILTAIRNSGDTFVTTGGSGTLGVLSGWGRNPTAITVPNSALTTITNTVLLTVSGPTIMDYSVRQNYVSVGDRNGAYYTSGWDCYQDSYGPFPAVDFATTFNEPGAPLKYLMGDVCDSNGGFQVQGPFITDSTYPDYSWMMHLVQPWTMEFWICSYSTNPASPSNYTHFYNATTAGHEGFQFLTHYSNGGGSSALDICLIWRTAAGSGTQYIGTSGQTGNLRTHSYNHIVIQFDPTKTNKVSMFCNGLRVATTNSLTPGQKTWCTYRLVTSYTQIAGLRISSIARYDNDNTYLQVPYNGYVYDKYTHTLICEQAPILDKPLLNNHYQYGTGVSYKYKKFGNGSLKFSNRESTLCERIAWNNGVLPGRNLDIRQIDFTIEVWAQWWDLTAGGSAPNASVGNVLWHFANNILVRIDQNGYWRFDHASGGGTSPSVNQTYTSNVLAATTTSGRWDHVVMSRRNGNFYYYINGVEKWSGLGAQYGSYSSGQGITYDNSPDYYSDPNLQLGCDYNSDRTTAWNGFVQDFRFTLVGRYETRWVDGIPTMCHVGTSTPALPTRLFPTK